MERFLKRVSLECCHIHPYCVVLSADTEGRSSLKKRKKESCKLRGRQCKLIRHPYLFHWPSLGLKA